MVFWIFVVAAGVHAAYYLLVFARLHGVKATTRLSDITPPVSVIICAHNEAENLKKYLKVVLIQQYPAFEVILVNDRSTDNTIDVMVEFYKRNTNVRIIQIEPDEPLTHAGKKEALMRGLQIAQHDLVVLTDADCKPASTHWLAKLVSTYSSRTAIVLGYSPFEKKPGLLNKLMRYENVITALQYLGFAHAGMPYMGVGRNLSYRKELLKEYDGFQQHAQLPTGDDDLLVNALARRGSTQICIDKDTFMYTNAPLSWSGWLQQKRRHLRSGFRYRWYHQLILFLLAFSGFLFYFTFLILLVTAWQWKCVAAIVVVTVLLKLFSTMGVYKKLEASDLVRWSPLLDVMYTGYLLIVFFLLLLKPKSSWI